MMGKFLAATIALGSLMLSSGLAHAQGTVRSVHNDWQIRCDTHPAPRPSNAR